MLTLIIHNVSVVALNKLQVIGFGALNMDEFLVVDHLSRGEKVTVKDRQLFPGGSASNTIVGLSRLGIKTGLIGALGKDDYGKAIYRCLEREKVDLHGVVFKDGMTGRSICIIDKRGSRSVFTETGVNDFLSTDDIDFDWLVKADFLHFSSFGCVTSGQSFETQKEVVNKTTMRISFHPSYSDIGRGMDRLVPIFRKAEILFLSDKELAMLTDEKDLKKGVKLLIQQGVKTLAVTRGKRGCFASDGTTVISMPPQKAKVVDTTGAGDAFAAGFLYGFLKRRSLKECAFLGNVLAAYCIGQLGAQTGLPTYSNLKSKGYQL
jgi:ribokinase